jgi:hypothetical protein
MNPLLGNAHNRHMSNNIGAVFSLSVQLIHAQWCHTTEGINDKTCFLWYVSEPCLYKETSLKEQHEENGNSVQLLVGDNHGKSVVEELETGL